MSDPERLLDSDDADPEVRALLRSLRDLSPESGSAARNWSKMTARVAALPVLATATRAAASGTPPVEAGKASVVAWKALALKLTAGALATGLVGAGVVQVTRSTPYVVSPRPETTAVATSVSPRVPFEEAVVPVEPSLREKPNAPPAVAPSRRSALDEEASMLARARSALRRGDAHGATLALNQLQSAFPAGQLAQERDVLSVEVLAANGNIAAAKRKAQAFIAAHPRSPHSAKLGRFVEAK